MPPSEGSTATSQSLERGLAILSSFHPDRPLIGGSELSRELDLSRSTAHRYVATLAKLGYLQQDPDSKRYRLGPRVLDLGFSAINSMDLREIAAPRGGWPTRRSARSTPRSSTALTSLHRALPTARLGQQEIDPQPARGSAPAGVLHVDGQGDPRVPPGGALPDELHRAQYRFRKPRGPNTLTDPAAFREELARSARPASP